MIPRWITQERELSKIICWIQEVTAWLGEHRSQIQNSENWCLIIVWRECWISVKACISPLWVLSCYRLLFIESFVSASPKSMSLAGIPERRYSPNNHLRVWGIRSFRWCLRGAHVSATNEIVCLLWVSLARCRLCFGLVSGAGFVLWSVWVSHSDGKKKFVWRSVSRISCVVGNFQSG